MTSSSIWLLRLVHVVLPFSCRSQVSSNSFYQENLHQVCRYS
ncbi:hypothetical protein PVAP13_2KG375921 [Panicum virgatum]|uniref:Uncharacterized protein n=1 Tax=Panicum virgatum TaxID=38727 RepID=A0A8T0WFV2_PANVG|nr:hypothetical protein PVAP13_2KG375921 [Panicum virgatum]